MPPAKPTARVAVPATAPASPTATGRLAEAAAAQYLEQLGHTILARNWRNRWCELDLITRSPAGIHIVEVKYRRRTAWGTGFEYISRDKVLRLRRAAQAWTQAHRYTGPYQIDVISLSGELVQPTLDYLPNITQ
jgi:uncharacterized protein (TIGR00252 family)